MYKTQHLNRSIITLKKYNFKCHTINNKILNSPFIVQEVKPSDVPADRSWCNGCGQLFKPDKDKAVYQCPQCDQVINSTISQVMKNKELWLCGFFASIFLLTNKKLS